MSKHVEGLRMLADILANDPPEGMTYADQPLSVHFWFGSVPELEAAVAKFELHCGESRVNQFDDQLYRVILGRREDEQYGRMEVHMSVNAEDAE